MKISGGGGGSTLWLAVPGAGIECEQTYSARGGGWTLLTVLRLTPSGIYFPMTLIMLDRVGPALVDLPQALLPSWDSPA